MTGDGNPNQNLSPAPPESVAEEVAEFCRSLFGCMRLSLRVEAAERDGIVSVNVTGEDRPALLSGTAALLNSIEYLANKVFRTGKEERIASITLDSDSYRKHREAELTLLAEMAARKVIAQGRPMTLQPMNPRERRIVHLALAGIEGVRSASAGEGESRSVTIHPAR